MKKTWKKIGKISLAVLGGIFGIALLVLVVVNLLKYKIYEQYYAIESTVCEFADSAKETVYHLALGRGCEKPYLRLRPFSESLPAEIDESATAEARLATHVLPADKNAKPGRECACTAANGGGAD
jgi:hypothetical protein